MEIQFRERMVFPNSLVILGGGGLLVAGIKCRVPCILGKQLTTEPHLRFTILF